MPVRAKWLWVLALIGIAAAIGANMWLRERANRLPEGLTLGNGRIEAEQIDIAAKTPGRVANIHAAEGDMVASGQLLAEMDTAELLALLVRAEAETALARQNKAEAESLVLQRRSELRLAEHELLRTQALAGKGHVTEALLDERRTARDVALAVLGAAEAFVKTTESRIAVAEAEALRIQTQIDDSRLIATANGRVLYRLAERGEVVAAGAPVLTILSLANVYMEIFLPAAQSGLLPIGADARIVLDVLPDFAIPAHVSFVSPEAQFTPKQVETLSERENLVFRVKVRIDPERVREKIEHVKTGLRGIAYVKLDPSVDWPVALEQRIPAELFE